MTVKELREKLASFADDFEVICYDVTDDDPEWHVQLYVDAVLRPEDQDTLYLMLKS